MKFAKLQTYIYMTHPVIRQYLQSLKINRTPTRVSKQPFFFYPIFITNRDNMGCQANGDIVG